MSVSDSRRDRVWGSVDRAINGVVRSHLDSDGVQEPFLTDSDGKRPTSIDQNDSWSSLLIVTAAATTVGTVIPAGYNIGILNSPQQIIVDFCNASILHNYGTVIEETPLELLWAFVVSIFLIGGGLGAFIAGSIANRIGRKNTLLVIISLNVIAAIFYGTCGLAKSVEMLLIARLIVGIGAGLSTTFVPLYLSELSTPATQNVLGLLCPVGINVGLFIGQVLSLEKLLGNEEDWNWLLALTCIPALLCLAVWYYLPETPRYLFVIQQKTDTAFKELSRLRGLPIDKLGPEIEELRREATRVTAEISSDGMNSQSNWTWKTIWANKNLRWPVICVMVMHFGNQISGINAVLYYSTDIFLSAGLDRQQAELAILGAGFINVVMTASVVFLTARFCRRPLMMISTSGISIFLTILAICIYFISKATWIPYCCIAALLLFVVFFDLGVGPLPFFLPTELIPAGPRPLVMSLGCLVNFATNFVIGMTFPSLQSLMGVYVFAIFAVGTFAQAVFLFFKLPETFRPPRSFSSAATILH
ncbi:solute carrier family 2, facilitated glucose transporter member 3-like [Daphnia pulicaria]|uniref:solute carrier family 2, facilitated glucose transporter member 3-like n=1 Tax=Daphnia pulicaria TaxID=35523 RepID=UPI001EEA37BC|nr:solute carrier family 2, facilitated glucose transporter member 3-like [Daphnia pulicaria]